mmetsp:Transcript_36419/g.101102  ORF Transcript_36419/g.101102 Transcript_36419/m.101102 type:complete len:269 (-) Transcript_36419:7-813(-)
MAEPSGTSSEGSRSSSSSSSSSSSTTTTRRSGSTSSSGGLQLDPAFAPRDVLSDYEYALDAEQPALPLRQILRQHMPPHQLLSGSEYSDESDGAESDQPLKMVRKNDRKCKSEGTIGHPELCKKPCVWRTRQTGCVDGRHCNRCHICCYCERKGIDKMARLMLCQMPYGRRAFHGLFFLRARAKTWGFEEKAAPFLDALQAEADAWLAQQTDLPESGLKAPGHVWRSMRKLTFAEVCQWAVLPRNWPPSQLATIEHILGLYKELRETV